MGIEESEKEKNLLPKDKLISEYKLQVIKPQQVFELPKSINFKALENLGVGEMEI